LLPEAKVGIAPGLTPCVSATQSPEDIAAAARQDGYDIRWFMDPVYGKGYPKDIVEIFGITPPIVADDMDVISTPTDFLGVNFYLRSVIADDPNGEFLKIKGIDPADSKYTGMGWEICAPAFKDLLVRIKNDYSPKEIFITENGSAWDDVVQADGSINDVDRIEYLELHLEQMQKAISEGVPVKGYFAWSFMDNFEWTFGYEKRFGLIRVDYDTLKRTPKASAHRYREIILVSKTS
jgi:beta-glucosidase